MACRRKRMYDPVGRLCVTKAHRLQTVAGQRFSRFSSGSGKVGTVGQFQVGVWVNIQSAPTHSIMPLPIQ